MASPGGDQHATAQNPSSPGKTQTPISLADLPFEIQAEILRYTSAGALFMLSQTCRHFHGICPSWQQLLQRDVEGAKEFLSDVECLDRYLGCFTCFRCMSIYPNFHFTESMMKRRKSKMNGTRRTSRLCIRCGVETRIWPEGTTVVWMGETFLICTWCGLLKDEKMAARHHSARHATLSWDNENVDFNSEFRLVLKGQRTHMVGTPLPMSPPDEGAAIAGASSTNAFDIVSGFTEAITSTRIGGDGDCTNSSGGTNGTRTANDASAGLQLASASPTTATRPLDDGFRLPMCETRRGPEGRWCRNKERWLR